MLEVEMAFINNLGEITSQLTDLYRGVIRSIIDNDNLRKDLEFIQKRLNPDLIVNLERWSTNEIQSITYTRAVEIIENSEVSIIITITI